jgi:hypothetical protein
MPRKSYRAAVEALVLDTLWSLWAELGAGGWTRHHSDTAVDVEPLIIATNHPRLRHLDPRLIEQALNWSIANVRLVSAVRLRNLLKDFPPPVADSFGAFAATVRRETHANWPGDGKVLRSRPPISRQQSKHEPVPDLNRPALIQPRLRGGWGVSARAEIIRLLLAEPNRSLSISELAGDAAFGRDNVADAVDMMVRAGILRERGTGGWRQYQLAKRDHMVGLMGPQPATFPNWASRFRFTLAVWELAATNIADPLVRAAEIMKLRRDMTRDIARNGIVFAIPQPGRSGNEPNQKFDEQSLRVLRNWSGTAEAPD